MTVTLVKKRSRCIIFNLKLSSIFFDRDYLRLNYGLKWTFNKYAERGF